ncbi:glycosyltransferase family 4 protein [Prosthecobacter fluviatilis]|uniref:Glycosyltransferase family 4 protein n=1 Tax=Prosthecobacter fluviatilis TaxID=445931 RepID=A0ABW0KRS3_9BACT
MRILLHSHTFHPAVGGVETISATLADNLVKTGHDVLVVTETPFREKDSFSYRVVRGASFRTLLKLARNVDIIHSNGASLKMVPLALLAGKPFLWTHNGYQVSCIDGLGWDATGPTPMTPLASAMHHAKIRGFWSACRALIILGIRRWVAHHVAFNAAATHWIAKRQPLPRQIVLYTPYPLGQFLSRKISVPEAYDFVFVGRLVNEKGVETLLKALSILRMRPNGANATLLIVGDGPLREPLQALTRDLSLEKAVRFAGALRGESLLHAMASATVGVVPSAYEEPMGGVALEMIASGRSVIVSRNGGMSECVGDAGVNFKNGNADDLAEKMSTMLGNSETCRACLHAAAERIKAFAEDSLTQKYVDHYQSIIENK